MVSDAINMTFDYRRLGISEKSFKKCRKKLFTAYVCKPEVGVALMNGKFIPKGGKIPMGITPIDASTFVICDSVGNIHKISANALARDYQFLNGSNPEPINQETLNKKTKNGVLGWTVIQSVPNNTELFACHIPLTIQFNNVNKPGEPHGKGDFLVCPSTNGQPNMNAISIVKGLSFAKEYSNQGWTDCIDQRSADAINITIDKLPRLPEVKKASNKEDEATPEDIKNLLSLLCFQFAAIFYAEGFKISDNGSSDEDLLKGRARMTIAEEEGGKQSTIFFTLNGKTGKFNIKCRRDGKEFDKTYDLSRNMEGTLKTMFICSYLDFCTLFKMTPFRFITKPRWLGQNVNGAEGQYGVKINQNSFEHDFAENSSASSRFQAGIFDTKANKLLSTYNIELRINLNKTKIKELISEIKSTGAVHPTLERESFIIKIKVANAPVQQIGVDEILYLRKYLVQGFLAERARQGSSNAAQKEKLANRQS